MPEWDKSWNDYMHHMLFAVDSAQSGKILGTFFSKGDFIFDDNKITGSHIIWLPTQNANENEYNFYNGPPPPNNINYLFHRDSTGNNNIYTVTNYKSYSSNSIDITHNKLTSSLEVNVKKVTSIKNTEDLRKEIINLRDKVKDATNILVNSKKKKSNFGITSPVS